MKQNDFYEVDGYTDFIPVTINETYADGVGVTVDNHMQGYRLVVKEVYRFPKVNEPQKPKVPQVAVEFYEKYKADMLSLDEWFSDFYSNEAIEDFPRMEELTDWLHDNDNETNRQRELALATLIVNGANAVEIEQDKLYTVEIEGVSSSKLFKNIQTNKYLFHSGNGLKGYTDRLTEQEIKQADERLWQWAVEVEEAENDTEV